MTTMRTCSRCILGENHPGVVLNAEGLCPHCAAAARQTAPKPGARCNVGHSSGQGDRRQAAREKLDGLLASEPLPGTAYDMVLAYSGGKDSSYVLKRMRETTDLRILAVSLDNAFVSERARQNMARVVGALDVDHVLVAPGQDTLVRAFARSLEQPPYNGRELQRASAVCNTCMYLIKSILLRTAVQTGARLICYGWSPGQVPAASACLQLSPGFLRTSMVRVREILERLSDGRLASHLLTPADLDAIAAAAAVRPFVSLAPLAVWDYEEHAVMDEIAALGWRAPKDTDPNSSNCLLNGFAVAEHVASYGFHPYAEEMAGLVRCGAMTRQEALERLAPQPDNAVMRRVRERFAAVAAADAAQADSSAEVRLSSTGTTDDHVSFHDP